MGNREEEGQIETEVARLCRSRLETNGNKKMRAYSKR
jgi:hypothetical protein